MIRIRFTGRILFLFSLVFMVGCNSSNTKKEDINTSAVAEESTDQSPPVTEPGDTPIEEEDPGFDYSTFDGITIRNAPTYDNPNLSGESNGTIPSKTFVNIAEKGDRLTTENSDDCDKVGYHWYAVAEGGGAPSWVSGADIYLRSKGLDYFNNNMEPDIDDFGYKIGDSFYRFDMAASTFEEPDNLQDPLGCETYGMPFLYIETEEEIFPIVVPDELREGLGIGLEANQDNFLLLVLNSEYGSARIIDVNEEEEGKFVIDIIRTSIENTEEIELSLKYENGEFLMTGLELR